MLNSYANSDNLTVMVTRALEFCIHDAFPLRRAAQIPYNEKKVVEYNAKLFPEQVCNCLPRRIALR